MYEKIVVPLDGSKPGEAALPYAVELCQRLNTPLTLLRIVEPGMATHTLGGLQYVDWLPEQVERLMSEARDYLAQVSKSLNGIKQVSVEVRQGSPARDLMRYSDEVGADLVVMSTHGRSGLGRWVLGSVAEKVVRYGEIPILLVNARPG